MCVRRIERFQAERPGAVLDAKAHVFVGLLAAALALLPEQLQRDAEALELLVDPGAVRLELAARPRHRRSVQALFELLVAERLGRGPVDTDGAREQQELANDALADTDGSGDLGIGQPGFEVQAQSLSYLTHRVTPAVGYAAAAR
jgi:hypothetical protein